MLSIANLRKRFGAVVATDGVDLVVGAGEVHAIIGPNGAGKTTLVAQVAGEVLADAGHIEFLGHDITRMPAYRRCLLGMGRSFQITSVFLPMTLLDNVALAAQAHAGHSFRFWRQVRRDRRLNECALRVLRDVGLDGRADVPASEVSHGEHRQLEIAMALVAEPRLLVLDEPMAGMGPEETWRMVDILRDLKGKLAMLWIEHDMDAVFALADRVSVLVYGRVLASGAPETIRSDAQVRRAYLGDEVL